jgi:hypothetical protein
MANVTAIPTTPLYAGIPQTLPGPTLWIKKDVDSRRTPRII